MGNTIFGIIMGLSASISWASAAVLYRKALQKSTNPFITSLIRTPIALFTLLLITIFNGKLPLISGILSSISSLLILMLATFVMNILGDTLYLLSIRNVGVAMGYPISYTYPILVAILAWIILGETLNSILFIGIILGVLGVWLISQKSADSKLEKQQYGFLAGILAAIGASLSFSIGIIIFRIAVTDLDPILVAVVKLFFLILMCSPIVLLKLDQARREIDKKTLIIAMIGGFFGIGVGDWFFYLSL
ncbi:MAG: DMT family transporter, partial [Candidatus Njordarchaeales archaeon]